MPLIPTEIAGRLVIAQGIFVALRGEEIKITPFVEQPEFFVYIIHNNSENPDSFVTFFTEHDFGSLHVVATSPFRSGVMRSTKEPVIIGEDETHRYELRMNYTLVGNEDDHAINGSWIVLSGDKS